MANYNLGGRSKGAGMVLWKATCKYAEFLPVLIIAGEPGEIWSNGGHAWIQRIKYD